MPRDFSALRRTARSATPGPARPAPHPRPASDAQFRKSASGWRPFCLIHDGTGARPLGKSPVARGGWGRIESLVVLAGGCQDSAVARASQAAVRYFSWLSRSKTMAASLHNGALPAHGKPRLRALVKIAGLIRSRNGAKCDGEAVPAIDGHNCQSQLCKFFLRKVLPCVLENFVRHMVLRDQRNRLSPRQSRLFTFGIKRRLPPRWQTIQPLFGFALRARVLGVHVEAEGATVDLRSAHADQFQQRGFQARGFANVGFEGQHGLIHTTVRTEF